MQGPSPDDPHPMKGFPQVGFLKPLVKNPNIVVGNYAAKRRILAIHCLNWMLEGATLVATMRKPFDLLAKGLVSKDSRGDRTAIELFASGVRVMLIALTLTAKTLATV